MTLENQTDGAKRGLPEIGERLNRIAAQLPLLDKSDMAPFVRIADTLDSLLSEGISGAFATLTRRTIALIENIVMHETPFEEGCKKLGESIAKMLRAAGDHSDPGGRLLEAAESGEHKGRAGQDRGMIPDDLKVFAAKFAASQHGVLEDFEARILEWEKGVPQAKEDIKRILHTWKGEFGVLGMSDYSGLIHTVEERLHDNLITGELLLRLKDFLAERMNAFIAGRYPPLLDSDLDALCGSECNPKDAQSLRSNPVRPESTVPEDGHNSAPGGVSTPESPDGPIPEPPPSENNRPFEGDPSLLEDFINESRDHIHTAEMLLLDLETAPGNMGHIDGVFRAWHTIKGVAGFLNLKAIGDLAHGMESVIDKARKNEIALHASHIDILLEANDCLKTFVRNIEDVLCGGALKIPENYAEVVRRVAQAHSFPNESRELDARAGKKRIGEILVDRGIVAPEIVEQALARQKAGDSRKIGEILIEERQLPARAVGGALAMQAVSRQTVTIEETIRVPVNRIDQLVDTIGEAVIAHSMIYAHQSIAAIQDQTVHTKIAHAAMIMRSIQEMAMSLRMVSVKSTFQKMTRLARDLAKKFNREIDFFTDGEDTELDKSVVENIGDPLIHMIRNAMDHGVEPPEERLKAGKGAKATVRLKAYHRAGNIYIEVSDDGRGLDRDAIFAKAVGKGLCKAEDRLSDDEVFRFIFFPGFSTAKQVTEVSGRGVGMDVVRRNVERLRGSVEIASQPGKGTTFTIRLPLTLAIVDGMIVRANKNKYIIPTLAILESLKPDAGQLESVMRRGMMLKVRGDLIPLVRLESIFGRNGAAAQDYSTGVVMIVEDMLGKKIGLHLDEIIGQQQVVIKSLGEGMGDVPGITGGAIMSDGTVSLILDVGGIVKMAGG